MRWFWIDKFLEFESGRRAVALKNVSYGEEHVQDYVPGYGVMPASLLIEGLAQTGGLLVGELNGFRERVILAKLTRVVFHGHAVPGDALLYTAILEDAKAGGAFVAATAHVGPRLLAEAQIVFAHLDQRFSEVELFDPAEFLGILRTYGLYDVGRTADGLPLDVPAHLLAAEQAMAAAVP